MAKKYEFTVSTLSNGNGVIEYDLNSKKYYKKPNLVNYRFEVNLDKKTVEVSGGGDVWNFQLRKGRFVRNEGNNHTPEGVKSMLEQMAQWVQWMGNP